MICPFYTKTERAGVLEVNKIISQSKFISVRIDENVKAIGVVNSATITAEVSTYKKCTEIEFLEAFNTATEGMQIMFGKHITAQA